MFDVLDMGASGLAAQRVRMDTIAGNVVNINVPIDPTTGRKLWDVTLAGGDAALFKFNDGAPFVGAVAPALVYWDSDSSAGNNNSSAATRNSPRSLLTRPKTGVPAANRC